MNFNPLYLYAGLVMALTLIGNTLTGGFKAEMQIIPQAGWPVLNELVTVSVLVGATTPVNVFKGDITFDPTFLTVESIDYNNSLADLWALEPWYSNGDGTLNFAGGTTKTGGFTGKDTLLTITFKTKKVGDARVKLHDVEILKHDGLGTEAETGETIDTLFTVRNNLPEEANVKISNKKSDIYVMSDTKPIDLNGDNKQSLVDVSMFMADFLAQNPRSDFDKDGKVSLADFNVIIITR